MNRFYSIIVLWIFISLSANAQISVGYINGYYSSYPATAIDYQDLSYIVMSFIYPNADGSISTDSWFLNPTLVQTAHQNSVKVLVSVGGFGGSGGFSPMAADTAARSKFVNNLVNFCLNNNFDGADLDWEYPTAADRNNFTSLCEQIREAFNKANISILSAAISSQDWNNAYDIAQLKNYLDWFGIMTYDYYGTWETTSGNDSPLFSSTKQSGSADYSVKYYLAKGMPKDKLCIGTPFGGYLLNSKEMYSSNSGGSAITYTNANAKLSQGWIYNWDNVCKVPYLQNPAHTQIITYDDTNSIKLKCEYINKNNLKGIIIWKIGEDYANSQTPLLSTLGKYLFHYPAETPKSPSLLRPLNNETEDSASILMNWNPVDSATSYSLQISLNENFSNFILNKTGINQTEFVMNGLVNDTVYYWRVNAANLNGNSNWSEIWSFKTNLTPTIIEGKYLNEPEKYELENYPNPFNPSTTIQYSIPKSTFVKLKVYNMLGEQIALLVNENKSPGTHKIKFMASNLPSGIYFYELETNNHVEVNKMQLLK
jgi:chitinase